MTTTTYHEATGAASDLPAACALGWSLTTLLREWRARVEATVGDLPHGPRGFQVLAAVVQDAPPSQATLAARLGIDRTVMTYLIDAYVDCGLVERQQDAADRRARRIVATQLGREKLADLEARVRAAERELLGGLTPSEGELLEDLLERAASGIPMPTTGAQPSR